MLDGNAQASAHLVARRRADGEFALAPGSVLHIGLEAGELRFPVEGRVWVLRQGHIVQRESQRIGVVLKAQKLQRRLMITLHDVGLKVLQPAHLVSGVKGKDDEYGENNA